MTDRFKFLENNDIVPAWEPQLKDGAAASDTSIVITLKNADRVAFLLNVGAITAGYTGRLEFYSCSAVDGSDAQLIEPIYFRQKDNDGSDTWGAAETITDGLFDFGAGGHCDVTEDDNSFIFEFEAQEIWQEGYDGVGSDNHDCISAMMITTNADGSDLYFNGTWILHPLRYSNDGTTSFDNRTD